MSNVLCIVLRNEKGGSLKNAIKVFDKPGILVQIIATGKKFPAHGRGGVAHDESSVIRDREGGEDPFAVTK